MPFTLVRLAAAATATPGSCTPLPAALACAWRGRSRARGARCGRGTSTWRWTRPRSRPTSPMTTASRLAALGWCSAPSGGARQVLRGSERPFPQHATRPARLARHAVASVSRCACARAPGLTRGGGALQDVAVKAMLQKGPEAFAKLQEEVQDCRKFHGVPQIVQLLGACTTPPQGLLIMEFMPGAPPPPLCAALPIQPCTKGS